MPGAVAPARAWPHKRKESAAVKSIPDMSVELLGAVLALLWGARVFLRSLASGGAFWGNTPAPTHQARPKGAELRYIRPLGRRLVAIRLQVILA